MDELQEPQTGPINPYARIFFWFWGLALLALAGFRAYNPAGHERLNSWHQLQTDVNTAVHAGTFQLGMKPAKQDQLALSSRLIEK